MFKFGIVAWLWQFPRKLFTSIGSFCFEKELKAMNKHMVRKKLWKD